MHPYLNPILCFQYLGSQSHPAIYSILHRQKRMMGMTPNEAELMDVESHYPTDRIPTEMKEKSVAENLLDKMAETQ